MGEKLTVNLCTEGRLLEAERAGVVRGLVHLVNDWIGPPRTVVGEDIDLGTRSERLWEESDHFFETSDLRGSLLLVYTRHDELHSGLIALEDDDELSCFRVSVRRELVLSLSMPEIERKCVDIVRCAASYRPSAVLAGMELVVDPQGAGFDRAIIGELCGPTLAALAVVPTRLVENAAVGFTDQELRGGYSLLRHLRAAERLGLILD